MIMVPLDHSYNLSTTAIWDHLILCGGEFSCGVGFMDVSGFFLLDARSILLLSYNNQKMFPDMENCPSWEQLLQTEIKMILIVTR